MIIRIKFIVPIFFLVFTSVWLTPSVVAFGFSLRDAGRLLRFLLSCAMLYHKKTYIATIPRTKQTTQDVIIAHTGMVHTSLSFQRQFIDSLYNQVGIAVATQPFMVTIVHGMESFSIVKRYFAFVDVTFPEPKHTVK